MTTPGEIFSSIGDRTGELLGRFFGPVSSDGVFSTTKDDDGATIITAAAFERVGGFGWGGGGGNAEGPEGRGTSDGAGGGGGGGGVTEGRPVAVIRIADGRVEITPVVDVTKVAVTFLVSAAALMKALR